MEKEKNYKKPDVRFVDIRYESAFLQSAIGNIDDWQEDDDPIDF